MGQPPNSDFRGFSGLIASGSVAVGDAVVVAPSGTPSTVARIYTYDGDLPRAIAGQSVTLVLADEVDASRGSVITAASQPPIVSDRLEVRLFWANEAELTPGATYLAKVGTVTANAVVEAVQARIDTETGQGVPAGSLSANDIGDVTLSLDRKVAVDAYRQNRDTGSLILIDRATTDTAALGLVQALPAAPKGGATTDAKAEPRTEPKSEAAPAGGGLLGSLKRLFRGSSLALAAGASLLALAGAPPRSRRRRCSTSRTTRPGNCTGRSTRPSPRSGRPRPARP